MSLTNVERDTTKLRKKCQLKNSNGNILGYF